jgi:hypothetical protein
MSVSFCVIAPAFNVTAATRNTVRRVITASCVAWFCLRNIVKLSDDILRKMQQLILNGNIYVVCSKTIRTDHST